MGIANRQIGLSEQREPQIQSCFTSHVKFHYLITVDELEDLLDQC